MRAHRTKAYLYLTITAIIWGIASVVIKFTLQGIDPLSFLIYRLGLSSIVALPFMVLTKKKIHWNLTTTILVIAYSLLSTTFALGLLFLGADQTTVLNLSLITITMPLLIEIAGVIVFKERITKREKLGSAIAILGSLLTVIEPIFMNNQGFGSFYGNFLIIAYMVSDIGAVLILKKLLRTKLGISIENLIHFSFITGFISLVPLLFIDVRNFTFFNTLVTLPLKYHMGVWYMALFSGTIAYALRARAQKTIEVGEAALFGYLTPLFTVPLAVVWLKESITPLFIMGGIIIAIGVFIAETKGKPYF